LFDLSSGDMDAMKIRILLADDHKIVRDGLRALIEREPDMEVIAESDEGRKAIQLVRELSPDVAILDIGMPGLNGVDATRQIIGEGTNVKVIALSMHSDKRFVLQMLKAGASGYLLKECAFEELSRAVHAVMGNRTYLSPEITGLVVDDYVRYVSSADSSLFSLLTGREREVLQLIVEGRTTKEIAASLHVSVKTIETHRQQIMNKLNVTNIPELVKYAIREGLTSVE
jgi:DNA-binding NarL/FixJ family response regulator